MKNHSSLASARIADKLRALLGREHASEQYVQFRIDLVLAQAAVREALTQSKCPGEQQAGRQQSFPVAADDVPWDAKLLARLLEDVSTALSKDTAGGEDLPLLSAAAAKDSRLLEQLARQAGFGPDMTALVELSDRLGVGLQSLIFFGRALAAPFVSVAVDALKLEVKERQNSSGCCPFCGSVPGLARLTREEGRRLLYCSLCGESWPFVRLGCPRCGSREDLPVLSVETDDVYSIETCGRCKRYLKTVDQRKLPEDQIVVPLVEAVATLHLDLIAEEEGYARALPYVALQ